MFCKVIRHDATPFVCTLYHSTLRWAISRNSTPFVCTLYHSTSRWAISRSATPFVCRLYHSTLRWAISSKATLFVCTLYHSTLRWAISRNATSFVRMLCYSTLPCAIWRNATLFVYCIANECLAIRNWASPFHNFMFQLDMGFYHLSFLSFIIWRDYSCLGCSVSCRKTKPSIIWPCHSFISYYILQLVLKPASYLLIYLTSLVFLVVTAAHTKGWCGLTW